MPTNNPAFVNASVRIIQRMGVDVSVQRGTDAPFTVRMLIEDGQNKVGQHGQIIGRLTTFNCLRADYLPVRGDLITVDGLTRKVEAIDTDDGIVVQAVLHG